VRGRKTNVDIPGSVTTELVQVHHQTDYTKATWRPSQHLVPGETYRFFLSDAIYDRAGNHLIPTYWDARASRRVENNSPALDEHWDRDADPIASGGAYITSRTEGSSASLTFQANAGQVAVLWGIRMPSGGFGDVYLDGVKVAKASFYAASPGRVKIYASPALSAGKHVLSVEPLGAGPSASSGSWVSIDNVTVGTAVRQETALKQHFRRESTASASGGSFDAIGHVLDGDGAPSYSATVVGTGVRIFATKTPNSGEARIYVDNVLKQTVNLHAASTVYKASVFATTFANGVHTIRIELVGTANGASSMVGFDYLTVT
jgi:hypothetical protein